MCSQIFLKTEFSGGMRFVETLRGKPPPQSRLLKNLWRQRANLSINKFLCRSSRIKREMPYYWCFDGKKHGLLELNNKSGSNAGI